MDVGCAVGHEDGADAVGQRVALLAAEAVAEAVGAEAEGREEAAAEYHIKKVGLSALEAVSGIVLVVCDAIGDCHHAHAIADTEAVSARSAGTALGRREAVGGKGEAAIIGS